MVKVTLSDGGVPYVRISKSAARKAWEDGKSVVFCPCKLYPFGGWRPSCKLAKDQYDIPRSFDTVVGEFVFYNCNNNEAGYYPAFYVKAGE